MAYLNGRIPSLALATTYLYYPGTRNGRRLLRSAAARAEAMATAFYLEFGKPLYATDGYRDYATQVRLKKELGPYAAAPGTSNHGWGRALDLASNVNVFSSAEHKWMRKNGPRFGFIHPTWAHDGNPANGMDEAWHFEDTGRGVSSPRVQRGRGTSIGMGHRGAKVREIQELLKKAGHKVAVDGDFGLATGIELLKYQKKHGLKQNGKADLATRRKLRGTKPKPASKPKLKHPPITGVQRAIRAKVDNKWGPDTDKRLNALRAASVYGGRRFPHTIEFAQRVVGVKPDGVWGPKSAAAHTETVKDLQRALHIKADGIYGQKTQSALNALEAKVK